MITILAVLAGVVVVGWVTKPPKILADKFDDILKVMFPNNKYK